MTPPVGSNHDSVSPEDVTELILRIFRVNGALLAAGDRLVSALGLTSARWQLLGGIAGEEQLLSVAQLARKMGNTRQAVQRIANELQAEGVISFRANPRHKRAQLIELTPHGRALFERSMEHQRPWAAALGRDLTTPRLREACATLEALLAALDRTEPGGLERSGAAPASGSASAT
jgi:DNA-binding MarR family transcriptional regulator